MRFSRLRPRIGFHVNTLVVVTIGCLAGCAPWQGTSGTSGSFSLFNFSAPFPAPGYDPVEDFPGGHDAGTLRQAKAGMPWKSRPFVYADADIRFEIGVKEGMVTQRGSSDKRQTRKRTTVRDEADGRSYEATATQSVELCRYPWMIRLITSSDSSWVCHDQDMAWKIRLTEQSRTGKEEEVGIFLYTLNPGSHAPAPGGMPVVTGYWGDDTLALEWEGRTAGGAPVPNNRYPVIHAGLTDGSARGYEILRVRRGDTTDAVILPLFLPWNAAGARQTYTVYFRRDLDPEMRKKTLLVLPLYNLVAMGRYEE